jgi:hypothetical protein
MNKPTDVVMNLHEQHMNSVMGMSSEKHEQNYWQKQHGLHGEPCTVVMYIDFLSDISSVALIVTQRLRWFSPVVEMGQPTFSVVG